MNIRGRGTGVFGRWLAVGAVVASLALITSPIAAAQPTETSTRFSSSVIGLNIQEGYAGYATPFVNSRLIAQTSSTNPGATRFSRDGTHCGCTVQWRNLDTGATGSWTMPLVAEFEPWQKTGSGRIEATAKINGRFSLTVVTGHGSWVVP